VKIDVPRLSDYHVHFRQFPKVGEYVAQSARYCGRVLAMPNLNPPITSADDASRYYQTLATYGGSKLDVLLAVKLVPFTTPQVVRECAAQPWVAAFKLYPAGVTTHSADGIPAAVIDAPDRHTDFCDVLDAMQSANLVLCLHGEHPSQDDPYEREPDFHKFVRWVVATFPRLRVVMEHITTAASADLVDNLSSAGARIAATITAHHLMCHRGHFYGSAASTSESRLNCGDGKCRPHLHCWPCLKSPGDRAALVRLATSKKKCVFGGSDSAPHTVETKETACGCAGVFNAPVLVEALVQVFVDHDAVDALPAFVAHSGDRFYGRKTIDAPPVRLVNRQWTVPERVFGIEPFMARCTLDWRDESML
jgi:dihydroorotase